MLGFAAVATMPPPSPAPVTYKKKDGLLSIADDAKYLFWTPAAPPNSSPTVTVPIADITNLQQTPASTPKVALKVVVKDDSYVFSFTGGDARKNQEAITDTLRNTIASAKASTAASVLPTGSASGTPRPQNGGETGQPAAMAIAKAVSSKASADDGWYDDAKLKNDMQLQRSLLESDQALATRFNQALKDRPDNVSAAQFTSQFWSARVHLLRAHAIEKAQKQGEYNVLPEIKFVRKAAEKEGEADVKQLHITKEQIKLIFKQYPVVSEAYDENVGDAKKGKMTPGEFWQRFFGSRLLKKLKGEKITQVDPPDGMLDKYLDRREAGPASIAHVPHFMDLEGNEQNHSQRKGNRPDQDMRPSENDKVPILRVLNNLSEKMLSHVAPEDVGEDGQHAPIGLDEETFEHLRLRDLDRQDTDTRVKLNVREQQQYSGAREQEDDDLSAEAKIYAQQDPSTVLSTLAADLIPSHLGSDEKGSLRLNQAIGYTSDSDSEDDVDPDGDATMTNGSTSNHLTTKIGSHASHNTATSSILSSIKTQRLASSTSATDLRGLSPELFDQLTITHNTTTEFLHYFWTLFLSGDGSRAAELAQLITTLDRSLDRINAVAGQAEDERERKIERLKEQVREYERRTGRRRRVDYEGVDGGKAVVDGMVGPTVKALGEATGAYRRAWEAQSQETGVGTAGG